MFFEVSQNSQENTCARVSFLTLSRRMPFSYRNQSFDLLCKSVDWFLYDSALRHERVNEVAGIREHFCIEVKHNSDKYKLKHTPEKHNSK